MPLSLDPDRERPPKEFGRFLGLFDKPLYRDWLVWWTGFWTMSSGFAIAFPTAGNQSSTSLPRWLDVTLAVLFFGLLFGALPSYVRVLVRRQIIKRRRSRHDDQRVDPGPKERLAEPPPRADPPSVATPSIPARWSDSPAAPPTPAVGNPPAAKPRAPVQLSSVAVSGLQSNTTLSDASRLLPYPVARATRRLQLASDAKEAYEAALRTGEVLTTVVGITAAAWAQHQRVHTDALDRLLAAINGRGVSQGTWLDAAQSVEKPMVDSGTGLPGMLDALRRGKGSSGLISDLKAVVEERNAWAHGASPQTKVEAGERLAELLPPLERALAQSLPLAQHDWLYVETAQYQRRDGSFLVTASRVMGDHPDWDRTVISSPVAVAVESFYVRTPFGLMDLTPLVVIRQCPTCRQPEVAYVDRLDNKKGVALKTFDRGHPLFDDSLVEDVRALSRSDDFGASDAVS
jgi:hypothetical protein